MAGGVETPLADAPPVASPLVAGVRLVIGGLGDDFTPQATSTVAAPIKVNNSRLLTTREGAGLGFMDRP